MPAFAFRAMASSCEVRLDGLDAHQAAQLAQLAIAEVRRIEQKYSRYRSDSVVARINAQAGAEAVECDAETLSLLDYAHALHQASGGLFDITSGVLRRAWDFGAGRLPDARRLDELRRLVGWERVERLGAHVRLPQVDMEIDFGGFGKEYAADRAAALLAAQGARHGYVNLGGDLRIIGPRADGRAWTIGIQDPRRPDRLAAGIDIGSGALATSGDYERFMEVDGKRYCHILDPKSGMPVSHWQSVSVLGPLAVAAGSCSTIAMLLQEDAIAYLDQAGVAYLAIDCTGQMYRRDL
ncbi:MAG: FAD:protein FMN transferase [Gammaproteobacteria bacterium]